LHIKTVLKNSEGDFEFEGELSPQEHALVIEVGLNTLFENGALPFNMIEKEEMAKFVGHYGDSN
jgi:hypothetical protein